MAHGSWKTTGGGGPGVSALIGPAVIIAVAVAVAVIIIEFAWLIISLGVIAAAVRLWLLYRRNVALAGIADAFMQEHARRAAEAVKAVAEQRAHEIEVARAGAQPVQIINVIDPAALLAAGFAPRPASYRAEVIRAEVER